MDTHVCEQRRHVRSRRETLRLGVAAFVIGVPAAGLTQAAMSEPPPSPQERIERAMREIEAAMREAYPDWRLQCTDQVMRHLAYTAEGLRELAPSSHAVLIYATADRYGEEEARLFIHRKPSGEGE